MKRSSFSYKMMRQSLSDITNSQSPEDHEPSDHINRLMKDNVSLVKLLEKRDKTIELSSYELRNLREGIHKLQLQNWSLAQTNSQFLGEINLAKNKVKALQHELTCKNALLKAKCCEQEKSENTQSRNAVTDEDSDLPKPFVPNRRRFIRSKSLGASTTRHKTEAAKEKSDENKRRQSRRRSARVRSAAQEVTETLFEIEDLQLTMPNDMNSQKDNSDNGITYSKEARGRGRGRHQDCMVHRSPVDRPSLRYN